MSQGPPAEDSGYELVVRGTLVLRDGAVPRGWLAVRDGTIAAVGTGSPPPGARHVHDAGAAYVLPGFVDGQTHATSYGGLTGIESTSRSAVAGGVTTMVDMPYDNPDPLNSLEKFQQKVEAIERSYADMALYATVIPGQGTADMAPLAKAGVAAFKISSFESHPVRFPRLPADETLAILEASVETGLPVGLHNEDQELVRATVAAFRATGRTTPEWHAQSRPVAAEMAATALFLELGAISGAHVHIVHFSHPRGYELVSRYRAEGVRATAEMCVHYLHFDADHDIARLGARMKVNPPIRGGVRERLWDALRKGQIDFISSDHSSWPIDNKLTASIFDAGAGIPGLETLGPSLYTDLVDRVADPVGTLVDQLSARPARIFGLSPRKGALAIGADADIAILETGDFIFDASKTHDGLAWSPYDGETFKARIAATFVRGRLVWDGSEIRGAPGFGRFIPRSNIAAPPS